MDDRLKLRVPLSSLTPGNLTDTLEGGTEGSAKTAEGLRSLVSGANPTFTATQVASLVIALDALLAMWHSARELDRRELDDSFELLVGVIEEWRDAVPKA